MKNLITVLSFLLLTIGYSQSDENEVKEIKIKELHVEVNVDSAEEIESTFKLEDVKTILEEVEKGEEVSFKIICSGETMSNGLKSSASYKVNGNTNDTESFLKSVKIIKKAAINYYKSKR